MNAALVILTVLVASVLASLALVAGVAALLRVRQFDAAARHTLWFATLLAIALLPLVGIGASIGRANRAPAATRAAGLTQTSVGTTSHRHIEGATAAQIAKRAPASPTSSARSIARIAGTLSIALVTTIDLVLAAGALLGLGILAFNLARIRSVKRRSSPLDGELAKELPWLTDPTLAGRETYLRLSYEIETPVAIGFKRPVILIPTELATHNGLEAIEDLVIHEHAHLRRFDDYTNLVQRAIERAFWFNPLVWFVGAKIALEREIAADDVVVARNVEVTGYADALWRLAREMRMPAHSLVAPGALFTRKQISVRIEALLAPGRARLAHLGPVTAACALVLAGACGTLVALAAPALELPVPPRPPAVASIRPLDPIPPFGFKAPVWHASLPKPSHAAAPPTVDIPAQHIEVPAQHIEVPAQHVSIPAQHIEVPAQHIALPKTPQLAPLPAPPVAAVPLRGYDTAEIARLRRGSSDIARAAAQLAASKIAAAFGAKTPGESDAPVTVSRAAIASCLGCNLAHRDLRGLDLHGVDLSGTDFNGADLRDVNLAGARLSGANLAHANLDGANLSDAEFVGVDISGASFRGARLEGLRLTGMSLRRTTFDANGLRAILLTGC
ncbi:MAG: M56 family metallopeptidase, partial [Candidatus Baltobacteraceae bacterium]